MSTPKERNSLFEHPIREFFCKYYFFPTYNRIMYEEGNRLLKEMNPSIGESSLLPKRNLLNIVSETTVGSLFGISVNLIPSILTLGLCSDIGDSDFAAKVCSGAVLGFPVLTNIYSGLGEFIRGFRE